MRTASGQGYEAAFEQDGQAALRAALDASGVVGHWSWDHRTLTAVYDAGAAGLLTGDAGLAGRPVPCAAAMTRLHPADSEALVGELAQATRAGGPFVAEYRVTTPGGGVRWLLSRGRTAFDGEGHPTRSRGILIDITESRADDGADGEGEDAAYVTRPLAEPGDPLVAAADGILSARKALGETGSFRLRVALDIALAEIGKCLAARITAERRKRN